jgi:hypothetical protein
MNVIGNPVMLRITPTYSLDVHDIEV